jgi:hypothetical protein
MARIYAGKTISAGRRPRVVVSAGDRHRHGESLAVELTILDPITPAKEEHEGAIESHVTSDFAQEIRKAVEMLKRRAGGESFHFDCFTPETASGSPERSLTQPKGTDRKSPRSTWEAIEHPAKKAGNDSGSRVSE